MSTPVEIVWIVIGLIIAALAWRASADQVREGRQIKESLGKLVSVTEPSPANILAAAAAKILTLDQAQTELTSKLGDLRKELDETKADLASQRRRTLSPPQRAILKAACEEDIKNNPKEPLRFAVFYNMWNTEAQEYARHLCEVFSSVGMSGVPGSTNEIARNLQGIIIRVKNINNLPVAAKRLGEVLRRGLISHRLASLDGPRAPSAKDDYLELVVGQSGAPQDVLDREIRLLKHGQQRTVSRDQWDAIRQVLTAAAQKQQRLSLSIKVPYGDLEAAQYGKDFMQIFNCGISYDNKIGADLVGLIIRVMDRNSVPPTASYLSQALKAAHIDHRTDSLDLQFPLHTEFEAELVIGSNG